MNEPKMAAADFVSLEHIPALVRELARIRKQRQTEFDAIADVFADPLELARLYVEPECQQENPANMPSDDMQADHRTPVFATVNRFLQKTHLDRDGRNHKIILADAGMGKSSLLVMLWSFHRMKFWPSSIGCELLKIGPGTLDEIRRMTSQSRTVLLLDALDEDPTLSDRQSAKDRLVELIDATLSFRKVILSCRTQFFVDEEDDPDFRLGYVRIGGHSCSVSYLSPFDDVQTNAFLEKRFPDSWHSFVTGPNKARIQALSISFKMGTLRMRPLLLTYIPLLLEKDEDGNSLADRAEDLTEYEIYRYMVTRWLDREAVKIRQQDPSRVVSASSLRTICWRIATQMQREGDKHLSEALFSEMRNEMGAPQFLSGQIEGRTLLNKDSRGRFRFAHYSIQEFLSVEHCIEKGPLFDFDPEGPGLVTTNVMTTFYEQHLCTRYKLLVQDVSASHPHPMLTKLGLHPFCLLVAATKFLSVSKEWTATRRAYVSAARYVVSGMHEQVLRALEGGAFEDRPSAQLKSQARKVIGEMIGKTELAEWDKLTEGMPDLSDDEEIDNLLLISGKLEPVLFDFIKLIAVGLCDLGMTTERAYNTLQAQDAWKAPPSVGIATALSTTQK